MMCITGEACYFLKGNGVVGVSEKEGGGTERSGGRESLVWMCYMREEYIEDKL